MQFFKYQGTGNDFILIDNRALNFQGNVAQLCDRRFGIGADGLMLLQNKAGYDFEMVYYNSDGNISSMCGNGGRCIVAFAKHLGIIDIDTHFIAIDGEHEARVHPDGRVSLGMNPVMDIARDQEAFVLDTGSPHYVKQVSDIKEIDLVGDAQEVRYNEPYKQDGINVNFIELKDKGLKIRTYERGVEDETLSCGTGVTAAAISHHQILNEGDGSFVKEVEAVGGDLQVKFNYAGSVGYTDIQLIGPAEFVFEGEI